jgi:DtxR family Mn-dependent transcriptional regulator
MTAIATEDAAAVIVRRIGEQLQSDAALMLKLKNIGIQPGREVTLAVNSGDIQVTGASRVDDQVAVLPREVAMHLFVSET